ncbi:MAG: LysR substrate-binding domain-containing protein, partial [Pseudomonadota bacterium]
MDKFAELKAFAAVVETGGFSAAARALAQSRSTTNRLVIALEERLRVQLLNRSTRQLSITSEGEGFYERARRILDDLEEAETCVTEASDQAMGRMRVSAPLTFGGLNISADVTAFMRRHPHLEVELNLETRMVDPVAEGYDIVVRVAEPDEETTLVDHRIASFRYIACAAPAYLARAGEPTRPEELRDHALLQHRRTGEKGGWSFQGPDGPVTAPLRPVLCSNNLDPLRDAALAGLGVSAPSSMSWRMANSGSTATP